MDFARVEAEFGTLKAQFEEGALSEEEFKAQIQELMIEDEQGRWWILGYETGQWYVHDGEQWVQQEPPRTAPSPPPTRPRYPGAAEQASAWQSASTPAAPSQPMLGLRLKRDTVSVLLITAGWLVLWGMIGLLAPPIGYSGFTGSVLVYAIAGAIGGLITGLILRRTEPTNPGKQLAVVTLGWALGWALVLGIAFIMGIYQLMIIGLLGGLAGGFITALALKWTHPSVQWKPVALITLGWGISWMVGGAIGWSLWQGGGFPRTFSHALWAGIGAGTGSWVMFWQLREAAQSTS